MLSRADLEAIRERHRRAIVGLTALSVNHEDAWIQDYYAKDIPALLDHIAALEDEREVNELALNVLEESNERLRLGLRRLVAYIEEMADGQKWVPDERLAKARRLVGEE